MPTGDEVKCTEKFQSEEEGRRPLQRKNENDSPPTLCATMQDQATALELSVGDAVRVKEDTVSAKKVALPEGTTGTVTQVDEVGDVQINFNGIEKKQWMYKRMFKFLEQVEVVKPSVQEQLRIVFQTFDGDKDGYLNLKEFNTYQVAVGRDAIAEEDWAATCDDMGCQPALGLPAALMDLVSCLVCLCCALSLMPGRLRHCNH